MTEEPQPVEPEESASTPKEIAKEEVRSALSRVSLMELFALAHDVEREIIEEAEEAKVLPDLDSPVDFNAVIAYAEDGGCSAEYHLAYLECKRARTAKDWPRYWRALLCLDKSCRKALPHLENIV